MDPDLIDVRNGTSLWSEPIEGNSDEILSLQDEIVEKMIGAMGLTLSSDEKAQIRRNPTENPEAYRLYAWGRSFYDKRTFEDYEKAIDYYKQAIDLDPHYALAWSGLADFYMSQAARMNTAEEAREAAQKALELDNTLAEAHASQAIIKLTVDWDFKGAEIDFKKAIDLDPNYATAHHWYGRLLTMLGRQDQAKVEMERALELNPADLSINRNYAWTLLSGRHYDEDIDQARMTYNRNPDFLLSKRTLALAYAAKSMYQEILELYESDEESYFVKFVHLLNLAKDDRDEAVKFYDEVALTVSGIDAAFSYSLLGEDDKVFIHLERAYENRNPDMQNVKAAIAFEKYHSDPRFEALLRKMGLD